MFVNRAGIITHPKKTQKGVKMAENKKKCRYCGVERANMAEHIINRHPSVLEKIEETILDYPSNFNQAATSPPPPTQTTPVRASGDIGVLIREKLDLMLNIKIIEMLSKSPNTTLQEINHAINPPPQQSLKELVELHNLIYPEKEDPPMIETGNQWVDIAQQAIPMVKDLLQSRKQPNMESDLNVRRGEKNNPGVLKPIQLEIAGDPGKPGSTSEKPGAASTPEQ
jgi:hypothetical protein